MDCGIYKITNLITDDLYIGQSTELKKRRLNHFSTLRHNHHPNKYVQRAFNKYGEDNFKFEILLYCEPFELTRYEQELVNRLNPVYNICRECVDSTKGVILTEETRKRMSESQKRVSINNFKGHHHTADTKQKISEANSGRVVSDDTKKKISAANLGKVVSKETREKIGSIHRGLVMSEEAKKRMSLAKAKTQATRRGTKPTTIKTTSKYVGVYFDKEREKYAACIRFEKTVHLGRFIKERDAALAYNIAAIKFFGHNAKLNIIEEEI